MVISCTDDSIGENKMKVSPLNLSKYSSEPPDRPVHLLFIHHSCGGQLLADNGPDVGENCIYRSHPNGGGLRRLLEENNYIVHEASYKSMIGDKTDICHWNVKFRDDMDRILTCKHQDEFFTNGTKNKIVMFKSCFPNSYMEAEGTQPGDPDSCRKTIANYKATYNALKEYFSKQPETLFIVVTAPPLVEPWLGKKEKIKDVVKSILGKENTLPEIGSRARRFNNWLKDVENGWLKDYPHKNIVVFDYYDILTDRGTSDWLQYPSKDRHGEDDDHPNSPGNTKAAQAFIPFINKSVQRMGL